MLPKLKTSYSSSLLTTSHRIFEIVSKLLFVCFFSSGGYSPSYVYRLVSELYHADDNYL